MIEIDGLDVRFGAFHSVREASFRVAESEAFGLIGESGSGKTTVLLFVSHNLVVIAHMCARVAVMNTGRIVERVATSALGSGALANPSALQLLKSSAGYDRQAAAALVSYD